jgi:hypothetical protein
LQRIKRKYGNVPRATVASIVAPPLDLSFHYEGGSRSLRATPGDAAPNAAGPTEATIGLVCFECLSKTSLKMEPCRNADVVSAAGLVMWSPRPPGALIALKTSAEFREGVGKGRAFSMSQLEENTHRANDRDIHWK